MPMFEELLERWDGEHSVIRYDPASRAWMIVCIHSTRLGPAAGGTRLKSYAAPDDALRDAMRLAAGMTRKLAVLGSRAAAARRCSRCRTPATDRSDAGCWSATATWWSRSAARS